MNTVKMLAYKNGSESAKALADALGIKMLLKKGSKFRGKVGDIILNWGSSEGLPENVLGAAAYTNTPVAVRHAANKLSTQLTLAEKQNKFMIPFVVKRAAAAKLIEEGNVVVCRTKLTGHSGEGIVIAETKDQLVDAPLYTVYKKKVDEYRVHVFNGEILDVQRKARRREVADENVNWKVRNLDGGFVFARENVVAPKSVLIAALTTVSDLGLLHGAVDIGFHKKEGTFVYEVNTACGLSGSTLYNYSKAFLDYLIEKGADKLMAPEIPEGYVAMAKQPITSLDEALAELEEAADLNRPLRRGAMQAAAQAMPPVLEIDEAMELAMDVPKWDGAVIGAAMMNEEVKIEPWHDEDMNRIMQRIKPEFGAMKKEHGQGLRFKHGNMEVVIPQDKMHDVVIALKVAGII